MNIKILQLVEGAKKALGLTVIIDVFRAFSTDCYVFGNGAAKMIPVESVGEALELRKKNPDYVVMGERHGKKPEGFDYGNSPTEIENIDFKEKTIVQTTTAGTQGILNAINALEIITGSFVNLGAVVNYIRKTKFKDVSLVCMGDKGIAILDEDTMCAEFIKVSIEDKEVDFQKIKSYLKNYKSAKKFFDISKKWAPERDFELCTAINRFSFIIRVEAPGSNMVCLKKHSVL